MSVLSQSSLSNSQAQVMQGGRWWNRKGAPFQLCKTCSSSSAIHDLAAFREGKLSATGERRLALHLAQCLCCQDVLRTWLREARTTCDARSTGLREGSGRNGAPDVAASRHREPPAACYLHLDDHCPVGRDRQHVVLYVAADPGQTSPAALGRECQELRGQLRTTLDAIRFEARWAVTFDDLRRHLAELRPTIVHFAGAGGRGGVALRDACSADWEVTARKLVALIAASWRTRMVVLNRCHSATHAQALRRRVPCVVGTPGQISSDDAYWFAVTFYRALTDRQPIGKSVEYAVGLVRRCA